MRQMPEQGNRQRRDGKAGEQVQTRRNLPSAALSPVADDQSNGQKDQQLHQMTAVFVYDGGGEEVLFKRPVIALPVIQKISERQIPVEMLYQAGHEQKQHQWIEQVGF
ncbi:hypothetical protein [Immundisolibacter sp.]